MGRWASNSLYCLLFAVVVLSFHLESLATIGPLCLQMACMETPSTHERACFPPVNLANHGTLRCLSRSPACTREEPSGGAGDSSTSNRSLSDRLLPSDLGVHKSSTTGAVQVNSSLSSLERWRSLTRWSLLLGLRETGAFDRDPIEEAVGEH